MSAPHPRLRKLAVLVALAAGVGVGAPAIASSSSTSTNATITQALAMPPAATASSPTSAQPKNRVRDFCFQSADRASEKRDLSRQQHSENRSRATTFASGSPLAARGVSSRILGMSKRQLQKKFKHASDFGVSGNYNPANASKFSSAINRHINKDGVNTITGTYRGNPVTHHLDPSSGLNVMSDQAGNFISGWKLNAEQLVNVLSRGSL